MKTQLLYELHADLMRVSNLAGDVQAELAGLEVLSTRYVSVLPDLLAEIATDRPARDGLQRRSYQHASGFDKLILAQGPENRYRASLHLWVPSHLRDGFKQELIHDHNMPFVTRIIAGGYTQHFFEPADPECGQRHTALVFGRLQYEPRGSEAAWLRHLETQRVTADRGYSMAPDELHQIVGLEDMATVTMSLFLQGKFHKDEVRLYVPGVASGDFPIAPRIPYTGEQLDELLVLATRVAYGDDWDRRPPTVAA